MTNPNPLTPEELAAIRERSTYHLAILQGARTVEQVMAILEQDEADRAALLRHIDALEAGAWRGIETAPKDGKPFLAWFVDTVDEYNEDRLVARGQKERFATVAYYVFNQIVEYPWRGAIIQNRIYTHWQPISPPKDTQ